MNRPGLFSMDTAWLRGKVYPLAVAIILGGSLLLGYKSQAIPLMLALGGLGALGLGLLALRSMPAGLAVLVFTAALIDESLATGRDSRINVAMLLVIFLSAVWFLKMVVESRFTLAPNGLNAPLVGFLAAALLSWAVSYAILDPRVVLPANIFTVQAGQVMIFVLTIAAFWLAANHPLPEKLLVYLTLFIVVAGIPLTLSRPWLLNAGQIPGWGGGLLMWPFVLLLGQLLFNPDLAARWKTLGWAVLVVWVFWALTVATSYKSSWVPALLAFGLLAWRKSWRLGLLGGLALGGALLVFGFDQVQGLLLGGEGYSASTRLPIWLDVLRLGARSAIIGLGPVNYKFYWALSDFESLAYQQVSVYAWTRDVFSPPAHNMFLDVFAQTGLVGLFFFGWALVAGVRLGSQAAQRELSGFARAYAYSVQAGFIALIAGSFLFAEWLLPFVYNLDFDGLRHSIYSWVLLGTLVWLGAPEYGRAPQEAPAGD